MEDYHIDIIPQPCQEGNEDSPDRCGEGNLWDQPPSQLKVLERTPEERWDNWRDSQHLSHNCVKSADVEISLSFTAALPATQGID